MVKKVILGIGVLALVVIAVALIATPESQAGGGNRLAVDIVANQRTARNGSTDPASLLIAVNDPYGPVYGLNATNFQVSTVYVAPGGCTVQMVGAAEVASGLYRMDIVPITSNPNCKWLMGHYALGVTVSNNTGSGTGVVDLYIQ
jgi:hypothetical protein